MSKEPNYANKTGSARSSRKGANAIYMCPRTEPLPGCSVTQNAFFSFFLSFLSSVYPFLSPPPSRRLARVAAASRAGDSARGSPCFLFSFFIDTLRHPFACWLLLILGQVPDSSAPGPGRRDAVVHPSASIRSRKTYRGERKWGK